MSVEVNRDTFETEVVQSGDPVLVDFWGPQCAPCLALMPAVGRLEQKYAGKIKITKVNAAENRMLCARLKIFALPTFLIYRDGKEVNRLRGDQLTETDLDKTMEAVVGNND